MDELWSRIGHAPTERAHELPGLKLLGKAEIDELERQVAVEEEILGLEVAGKTNFF